MVEETAQELIDKSSEEEDPNEEGEPLEDDEE